MKLLLSTYILNMCSFLKMKSVCRINRIFSSWYYKYNHKIEHESSYWETCWPPAWRLFVIVNCLYFTCFMFSLVWNLKKHSDSTRQPHCRILHSLQKIKAYHEVFQSYRKDTINTFFVNLVANIPFLTNLINVIDVLPCNDDGISVDKLRNDKYVQVELTEKHEGTKDDEFHSFSTASRNSVHKYGPSHHHNKHCLSLRKNVEVPSIVKTIHQKNASKYYDKGKFYFHNQTECTPNFTSLHYDSFEREGKETKGHCPDCKRIRSRLYKQHSCKHEFGRIQPKTCRVIYNGPYASRKRNNINKYTIQCGDQNPRHSVCEHVTHERKPERKRVSLFSNEENCESTIHSTSQRTKALKDQNNHANLKENEYLSAEILPKPPHNDLEEVYGTPWTKIDSHAKNFMPKNSVKYVYKKTNRPKNHEMNQNLVEIVSNALKKVSKSIKHERQYCQRHYTW